MRTFLSFLLLCLGFAAWAQQSMSTILPGSLPASGPVSDASLQAEIEALLGQSEAEIQRGLNDPGIDLQRLLTEKVLDEAIKALAQGAVYAPIAEKILSLYHQLKQQRLAAELGKLRRVLRDGQERLNKIRYQSLRIKWETQHAHRQPDNSLNSSPHVHRLAMDLKTLPDAGLSALSQLGGEGSFQLLREDFDAWTGGRQYLSYEAYLTIQALANGEAARHKQALAQARGPAVWTSPYQRWQLLRSAQYDLRIRTNSLRALGADTRRALAYQKRRRVETQGYQLLGVRSYTIYRSH